MAEIGIAEDALVTGEDKKTGRWATWQPWVLTVLIMLNWAATQGRATVAANLGWLQLSHGLRAGTSTADSAQWFRRALMWAARPWPAAGRGLAQAYLALDEPAEARRAWLASGNTAAEAWQTADDLWRVSRWERARLWYEMAAPMPCDETDCTQWRAGFMQVEPFWPEDGELPAGTLSPFWHVFESVQQPAAEQEADSLLALAAGGNRLAAVAISLPARDLDLVLATSPIYVADDYSGAVVAWGYRETARVVARLEVQYLTPAGSHLAYGPSATVAPVQVWTPLRLDVTAPPGTGWLVIRLRTLAGADAVGWRVLYDRVGMTNGPADMDGSMADTAAGYGQ